MTPTPTAIPSVMLHLDAIISTTQQLARDQNDQWALNSPTAPLFLGIACLLFAFGLLCLIKNVTTWAA